MTEKAPVADFSQVLTEFNQATTLRKIAQKGEYSHKYEQLAKWKELSAIRGRMLELVLAEKGLAICSKLVDGHLAAQKWLNIHVDSPTWPHKIEIDVEELKKINQEELGVFSKDQLKPYFRRYTHSHGCDGPWGREEHQHSELQILCPKHFSTKNWMGGKSYAKEWNRDGEFDFESEVEEIEGRLMTKVGGVDVTEFPAQRQIDEMIYRYFDLPQLPPKPEI